MDLGFKNGAIILARNLKPPQPRICHRLWKWSCPFRINPSVETKWNTHCTWDLCEPFCEQIPLGKPRQAEPKVRLKLKHFIAWQVEQQVRALYPPIPSDTCWTRLGNKNWWRHAIRIHTTLESAYPTRTSYINLRFHTSEHQNCKGTSHKHPVWQKASAPLLCRPHHRGRHPSFQCGKRGSGENSLTRSWHKCPILYNFQHCFWLFWNWL